MAADFTDCLYLYWPINEAYSFCEIDRYFDLYISPPLDDSYFWKAFCLSLWDWYCWPNLSLHYFWLIMKSNFRCQVKWKLAKVLNGIGIFKPFTETSMLSRSFSLTLFVEAYWFLYLPWWYSMYLSLRSSITKHRSSGMSTGNFFCKCCNSSYDFNKIMNYESDSTLSWNANLKFWTKIFTWTSFTGAMPLLNSSTVTWNAKNRCVNVHIS